jgi:hypothetical protein
LLAAEEGEAAPPAAPAPRRGPGGRFGGMGGEIGPEGQGILRLLRDEAARKDLVLTPDQTTLIEDLLKDADTAGEKLRQSAPPRPAPPPSEPRPEGAVPPEGQAPPAPGGRRGGPGRRGFTGSPEALEAYRKEVAALDNTAWQALTETQREKARQLAQARSRAMFRGPMGAILTPEAVKELGLSDEQVKQVQAVLDQAAEERSRSFRETIERMRTLSPEERRAQMQELFRGQSTARAERDAAVKAKVMAVLTPDQQGKAEKILEQGAAQRGRTIGRTARPPQEGGAPPPPPPPPPPPGEVM